MSKLSKLLVMALVILAVVTMSIKVSAYTNEDLKKYANDVHNINNMIFELTTAEKQKVQNYLTQHPVSDDVATSIKADLDAIESKLASTGATSIEQVSDSVRAEIIALAQQAGDKAGISVSVNTNAKTVTLTVKATGEVLVSQSYANRLNVKAGTGAAAAGSSSGATTASGSRLLYTGANYAVFALPVLAIVAVAIVAKKRA